MKKIKILLFLTALVLLISSFLLSPSFIASYLTRDGGIDHSIYLILIILVRVILFLLAVSVIILSFRHKLYLRIDAYLRRNLANYLLLFCSLLVALIILEIVLYTLNGEKFNNKNMEEKTYVNLEYNMTIQLNSDGFRDDKFTSLKMPGILRIFVLGDSFPFGVGVEENESFPSLLEEELNKNFPNKRIEVYNFGLPGRGPYAYLYVFKKYLFKYKPDLVITMLYLHNDIMKGSLKFERLKFLTFPNLRQFIQKSLLQVDSLKDKAFQLSKVEQKYKDYTKQGLINSALLLQGYYFKNVTKYYQTLTDNFNFNSYNKEILLSLDTGSKKAGARFILVLIPQGSRISTEVRKAQEKLGFIYDGNFAEGSDKLQKSIISFANEKEIYTIDLLPYLQDYSEEIYYPIDSHWNKLGHKFVSDILYNEIRLFIENE